MVAITAFEPVLVLGNEDRLKQLLLILLLDNASKYTPLDGRVTVELRRNGAAAEVTVQDTGQGIPAHVLPHVFERFYRADPARTRDPGGTGLGLPIAHWIVEQHGGSIALASQPGYGTTVTVTLPAAELATKGNNQLPTRAPPQLCHSFPSVVVGSLKEGKIETVALHGGNNGSSRSARHGNVKPYYAACL